MSALSSSSPFPDRIAVLLVEDDSAIRLIVQNELENEPGFAGEVTAVAYLREALDQLRRRPFDVALVDLNLPDCAGVETFDQIAAAAPEVPTVVMTSSLDENLGPAILRRGAQDYISKGRMPFGALARIVQRAIERHVFLRELDVKARALTDSEARVRAVCDASVDAIVVVDSEGMVRFTNPAAVTMFGRSETSLLGHPFGFPVAAGSTTELDIRRADGSSGVAEMRAVSLRWDGAQAQLATLRDITERKRAEDERLHMEARLRLAHKLEAIGQLAAGIAHEINTPAHFIGHNLEFARSELGRVDALLAASAEIDREKVVAVIAEIRPALADAASGLQRVAAIVGAMKSFSHPGEESPSSVDLNQTVEDAVVVSQHEWRLVAELVRDYDTSLPLVPLLSGEFHQVMLNLVVNAAHAVAATGAGVSRPKGTITVSTRRLAGWAEVRVRDTGAGVPLEIRHRLFEPFFTTKEVGRGTGQGLSHAHAVVVRRHGGELTFESELGVGTCFIVRLPVVESEPRPQPIFSP